MAAAYTPAKVQELIGVTADQLKAVAGALKAAKKPLVVPGSAIGQGGSVSAFVAGMALNRITSYNVCYTKLLRFSRRTGPSHRTNPAPRLSEVSAIE